MSGGLRHPANMAKSHRRRWFLKEWRKAAGFTQDRLAEVTGLSKPYISQLESGARQYNQELLESLAEVLRTSPADLIHRRPDDPPFALQQRALSVEGLEPEQVTLLEGMADQMRRRTG